MGIFEHQSISLQEWHGLMEERIEILPYSSHRYHYLYHYDDEERGCNMSCFRISIQDPRQSAATSFIFSFPFSFFTFPSPTTLSTSTSFSTSYISSFSMTSFSSWPFSFKLFFTDELLLITTFTSVCKYFRSNLNLWGRFFRASNVPGNSGGCPVDLITAFSN